MTRPAVLGPTADPTTPQMPLQPALLCAPCYPPTMDDRDTWRAANLLIQEHGPDAVYHASQSADELLERGDMDGGYRHFSNVPEGSGLRR